MSRIRPRADTLRPQITRSRTGSNLTLQLSTSQINKSSETSRGTSADRREKISSTLISNLLKLKHRNSSIFKENINVTEKSTPKQTFMLTKERLKRPLRSVQKNDLPRPNIHIAPIRNRFYEHLDKIESTIEDMAEMKKHISVPQNFFSPIKMN
ncbi:unnamed protein product [Blepharisma stoltei]|uniref:Uncharacterized protein n=1 Tax=Blepharisma stoltei TaxID=1481888 RepID=A0AAU9IA76_9CILI|nr:unnamed protein product [Blepharisma stoltei]